MEIKLTKRITIAARANLGMVGSLARNTSFCVVTVPLTYLLLKIVGITRITGMAGGLMFFCA
jgi:hypothetical protein